jgi:DNA polymerase-3 subunit epsilon
MSVLRQTLELYSIPFPTFDYLCSYIFSKKVWKGLTGYDLETLCKVNGIEFNHHRAGDDSMATAELSLKAFEVVGTSSINDFAEKLQISVGRVYDGGYRPCGTIQIRDYSDKYHKLYDIVGDTSKHNPDSIFYGKTAVFTGTLLSMTRVEAHRKIADIGGIIGKSVTKDTDFLIVGQQDYKIVGDDGMSQKQEKAIKFIEKGSSIEILSEYDFLNNL